MLTPSFPSLPFPVLFRELPLGRVQPPPQWPGPHPATFAKRSPLSRPVVREPGRSMAMQQPTADHPSNPSLIPFDLLSSTNTTNNNRPASITRRPSGRASRAER